ncbi:rhodanese-like domain-containing protein [Jannaschia aquimarina]|uniref:Molybdopterin biosynthesis protein MoeB n=1 Tax=Jannaschia aquimarina TaxID=935700 RepID=A0A0D1ER62_9RHOB|nr:rhodanese-like domain-containing protein [Jannaschia aquimarina]KIT18120.1 molybdopterin biosynthesis protein MoeB [Jannaschia aquimarina]SNT41074.1 Rhodanese-related sulfurtransferase [Jannaschia aquimarina]
MNLSFKDLVAEARERVDIVAPAEADGLILDVREPDELDQAGRVADALAIPRGVLETRADPESPMAEARLTEVRESGTVDVLCASGGRAALAADTLRRMGYRARVIEGGIAGWKEAGLPTEG